MCRINWTVIVSLVIYGKKGLCVMTVKVEVRGHVPAGVSGGPG